MNHQGHPSSYLILCPPKLPARQYYTGTMSLAAAASLRMKQKRVDRSPRSTAKQSISPHSSPGIQVPSPRNSRDDVSSIDKSPVASSPMVITTLNGGRSHYTHSLPGADPPGVQQPPHPHSAYHQHPHPPIHHHPASGSQLHHGGISHSGINSLDTSADYYVEGHHAHPLPSPTQHQQQYQLHTPGPPSPARNSANPSRGRRRSRRG